MMTAQGDAAVIPDDEGLEQERSAWPQLVLAKAADVEHDMRCCCDASLLPGCKPRIKDLIERASRAANDESGPWRWFQGSRHKQAWHALHEAEWRIIGALRSERLLARLPNMADFATGHLGADDDRVREARALVYRSAHRYLHPDRISIHVNGGVPQLEFRLTEQERASIVSMMRDAYRHSEGRVAGGLQNDRIWRLSREYKEIAASRCLGRVARKLALVGAGSLLPLILVLWLVLHKIPDPEWWPGMPTTFLGVVPFRAFLGIAQVFLVYSFLVLLVMGSYRYVTLRRAFDDRIRLEKADHVNSTIERLRAKLDLRDLFVLNRQQLDEYHVASVRQQSIAFRNAQIAAAIGFLTLLAGVVISLQGSFQRDSGDGLALGLTALASLLSGFIAAVFFRSAESTAKQLREFYKEPYRTAQVLAIERLAALESQQGNKGSNDHESMDVEARQQLRQTIVEGLLNTQTPDSEDKRDAVKTKDTKNAETSYLPVLGLGLVDRRDPHAVIRHKGVSAGTSINSRH